MKKTLIIIIMLLIFLNSIYSNINNNYALLIIPFINSNEIEEFNHLSDLIYDSLISELNQNNYIDIFKNKRSDKLYSKFYNKKSNNFNTNKIINYGENNDIDIALYGEYKIINEEIFININFLDIKNGKIIDKVKYKGKSGIDIYRIIDEAVLFISEKIVMSIKKIDRKKNRYYEISIGGNVTHSAQFYCLYNVM